MDVPWYWDNDWLNDTNYVTSWSMGCLRMQHIRFCGEPQIFEVQEGIQFTVISFEITICIYLYYILYYSIYYILLKNCSRSDSELQSLRPMYYVPLQYTLNLPLLRQVQGHPEHHVQGSYSGLIPFFMFCTIADYHDNHIYFVADSLDAWFCLRAVNHHCPDALDVIISYQILTSYSDTLLIRTCAIYANLDHMNHSFLLLLWSLILVCILHTPARPKASTIRDVGSLMETTSKGHEWPRL